MNTLQREWKALQRKQTRFKYKIIFTLILPIFLVVLGAKVLRTFLEIRLRQLSEPSVQPPARKDIEELPKNRNHFQKNR
ncbi:MAG: hypothetical protein ACLTKI_02615 [Lachnospiraceae bacterium]